MPEFVLTLGAPKTSYFHVQPVPARCQDAPDVTWTPPRRPIRVPGRPSELNMEPSRADSAPSWADLGPSRDDLGPSWTDLGPSWADLVPSWAAESQYDPQLS